MKRIFIFLFLSVAAMAADNSANATATLNNGRWWAAASLDAHLFYLCGLQDMLTIFAVRNPKDASIFSFRATVGDAVKQLDKFYDDPANLNVPIVLAMEYAKARFEGATAAQVEETAAALRAVATALNKAAQ